MSVYQFALKCGEVYSTITGKDCEVIRPYDSHKISDYFEYETKYKLIKHYSRNSIDEYLEIFIKKTLADYQNDIFYGGR